MCLDATVFVLLSVVILIETICPKICSKSRLKSSKRPLPVDVRRSKTSLLKLPNVGLEEREVGSFRDPFFLLFRSNQSHALSPFQVGAQTRGALKRNWSVKKP